MTAPEESDSDSPAARVAPRVGAVVLAAGASTRLGHPKQLVLHEGEPLVRRAARAALLAGADPVIVVLGAHAERVAPALAGLAPVATVVNEEWREGIGSSIAAGVRALGAAACDAVLVTLADQPLVDAAALRRLLDAFAAGARVAAASYAGTVGVPALFAREHLPDLARLTGDAGAGAWLRRRPREVTTVSLPGAALDIDRDADVARLSGAR